MTASTETASLIIKVDSAQTTQGAQSLDNLTESARDAQLKIDALTKAFSPVASAIDRLTAAVTQGVKSLADMGSGLAKVDRSNKDVAQSADQAAKATQRLGESEDEASARIRAMVQASMQKVQAQNAEIASSQRTIQMTDAQRAVMEKLNGTLNTQADMNARGAALLASEERARAKATAAVADQTGALSKLLGQIDPTIAAFERLDVLQKGLNDARKAGTLGAEDYAIYTSKIAAMREEVGKASHAVHTFSLNNSMARRELGRMAADIANGNWGRLEQTSLTLANYTGLLGKAFTGTGLAIGGALAIIGLFVGGAAKGWEENEKLRVSLIATGDAAGSSAGQLDAMAIQVGRATGHWGDARKAIEQFTASGKVAGAGLGSLALSAVNVSTVTGQSIDKAVQSIISLGNDPAAAVAKLNDQYHFLTSSQYAEIAALEAEGKSRDAARLAEQDYTSAMNVRAKEVEDNAGWIIRSAHSVRDAWNEAWGAVKNAGAPDSLADQVKTVLSQIDSVQKAINTPGNGALIPGFTKQLAALKAQLDSLRGQQVAAGLKMVNDQMDATGNASSVAAQKRLSAYEPPDVKLVNDIKKANADRLAALYGVVDPAQKALIEAEFTKQVQDANNSYQAALKRGSAHSPKGPNLDAGLPDAGGLLAKSVHDDINNSTYGYKRELTQWAQSTASLKAYTDAIGAQLAARQKQLDAQTASIGLGDQEAKRQSDLAQIYERVTRNIEQLNRARSQKGANQDLIDSEIAAQQASLPALIQQQTDAWAKQDAERSKWSNGWSRALDNFQDQAADVAGQSATLFTNAFNNMSDSLANFATTGKFNFKSLVASILADLAKMEVRIAASKILTSIISAWGFSYGTGAGNVASVGVNSSGQSVAFNPWANAKGGVYDSPSLSQYSGQIVNRPTLFAFASGAGLMGEAGPEAILPLKRGSDGRLGVQAGGTSGGISVSTTVNIDSNGSSTSDTNSQSAAGRQLGDMLNAKIKDAMLKEQRPGGILWKMAHP